jgi:hypothetical protein
MSTKEKSMKIRISFNFLWNALSLADSQESTHRKSRVRKVPKRKRDTFQHSIFLFVNHHFPLFLLFDGLRLVGRMGAPQTIRNKSSPLGPWFFWIILFWPSGPVDELTDKKPRVERDLRDFTNYFP